MNPLSEVAIFAVCVFMFATILFIAAQVLATAVVHFKLWPTMTPRRMFILLGAIFTAMIAVPIVAEAAPKIAVGELPCIVDIHVDGYRAIISTRHIVSLSAPADNTLKLVATNTEFNFSGFAQEGDAQILLTGILAKMASCSK